MRTAALVLVFPAALAACTQSVPNSAAGVGFGSYTDYLRQREAALASGAPAPLAPPLTGGPGTAVAAAAPAGGVPAGGTGFSTERIGAAIDAAEAGTAPPAAAPLPGIATAAPAGGGAAANVPPEAGAAVAANPPAISDEQDFNAVATRETIESDAARIARNRAQYEVVQPTAVPERPADSGPNIVAFALSTTHAPGTPVYRRSGLRVGNSANACARYGSPDRAQEAFLEAGGPERDRLNLDPDGDGFACAWDPRPFRTARP